MRCFRGGLTLSVLKISVFVSSPHLHHSRGRHGRRDGESLKKKGVAYIVGRANYRENARGRIIGDEDGFLKLLFRQDDLKLVGVHIMGDLGTEVVHIGLVAMMGNASANLFVDACLNSPTLGMLYKTATLNALQKRSASEKHA